MHPVVLVLAAKSGCSKVAAPAPLVEDAIGDDRADVRFGVVDAGSSRDPLVSCGLAAGSTWLPHTAKKKIMPIRTIPKV